MAERNCPSVWQRNLDGTQRVERDALLVGRAHDDVDQIDVIAHLGYGATRDDRIEHARERLRAQPKQARLVLVDLDPHLPGRFEPVEIDVYDLRVRCDDLGQLQGGVSHLADLRTADAILHRPSDRWAEFQRGHAAGQAGEFIGQNLLELLAAGGRVRERPWRRLQPG